MSIKVIDCMLQSGIGDQGRLEFIRRCMTKGRTLYKSDQIYLETLKAPRLADGVATGDVAAPETDEKEMVRHLEQMSLGDQGRLAYMRSVLESGGRLHDSDARYLRSKYTSENATAADSGRLHQKVHTQTDAELSHTVSIPTAEPHTDVVPDIGAVEVESTTHLVEEDREHIRRLSDYKEKLADRINMHHRLLDEIKTEMQEIKIMVNEQNSVLEEQAQTLEAIRGERIQLEEDAQRLVGVSAELSEERKKVAAARKEIRDLKEKGRSLTKIQKDLTKINRDIQKERQKVAKKIEDELTRRKEKANLKQNLEQEKAILTDIKGQGDDAKRGVRLAEKVLEESRNALRS